MLWKTRPKSNRVRKALTVLGLVILNLPIGVMWYAGNLTTYTSSYFIAKFGQDAFTITGSITLSSCYLFMLTSALTIFYKVVELLGKRYAQLLVIVLFNGIIFISYATVQHYPVAFTVILGITTGMCAGCLIATSYDYVTLWTTGADVGFATSLTTQVTFGAVLVNQLITLYINPGNVGPDLVTSTTRYFTQPEIINRTPNVFLVMGGVFLTVQILGFLLLMEPVTENHQNSHLCDDSAHHLVEINDSDTGRLTTYEAFAESHVKNGSCDNTETLTEPSELVKGEMAAVSGAIPDVVKTESKESSQTRPSTCNSGSVPLDGILGTRPENGPGFKHGNLSALEMLRHKEFYFINYLNGCVDYATNIVATSYKAFGQNWITDDHFMAILGTTVTACLVTTRLLWGITYDRFGVKITLVFQLASITVLAVFYYWTPHLSRWLFFIWTCSILSCVYGLHSFSTVCVYKYFGDRHFSSKLGLSSCLCLIVSLTVPFLFQAILNYLGWFWIFCSIGVGFFGALVLSVCILSENI